MNGEALNYIFCFVPLYTCISQEYDAMYLFDDFSDDFAVRSIKKAKY